MARNAPRHGRMEGDTALMERIVALIREDEQRSRNGVCTRFINDSLALNLDDAGRAALAKAMMLSPLLYASDDSGGYGVVFKAAAVPRDARPVVVYVRHFDAPDRGGVCLCVDDHDGARRMLRGMEERKEIRPIGVAMRETEAPIGATPVELARLEAARAATERGLCTSLTESHLAQTTAPLVLVVASDATRERCKLIVATLEDIARTLEARGVHVRWVSSELDALALLV